MNKLLKSLAVLCVVIAGVMVYSKAEQGDFWTGGYDTPNGRAYWRIDSSGYLKPGVTNTLDIGTSALAPRTIYVGTSISNSGTYSGTTGSFTGNMTFGDSVADTITINASSVTIPGTGGVRFSTASVGTDILYIDGTNLRMGVGTTTTAATLTVSGSGSFAGFLQLYSRTAAQITALTPTVVGQAYYCNDCSTVPVCVSTGTGVGAFSIVTNKASACS